MNLEIKTLGTHQVLVNGSQAQFKSKTAEELFFYLLAHPEGKQKEEILEQLWQAEPNKETNNRFRVTVHRIRHALDNNDVLLEDHNRYRLHATVLAATDLNQMYKILEQANHTSSEELKLQAFQQVIQLYQGDFLPSVTASWANELREELRGVYVRANLEISLLHCGAGACEGAVGALVRALHIDPYIGENYHQKLMTCLSVVEDKYAAIEHYRRFIHFLRSELEDSPMPETLALAERIKSGEKICNRSPMQFTTNCPFSSNGACVGQHNQVLELLAVMPQ
jgi:two-component SAPR family response regulator